MKSINRLFAVIFLSLALSSCGGSFANGDFEAIQLSDIQLARRNSGLSSFYGKKVAIEGKITRVAHPDDDYGLASFVMQNGYAAIYGEFKESVPTSWQIFDDNNVIVYGIICENKSFNDLTLLVDDNCYVKKSDIEYKTPYVSSTISEDKMFTYFGCLFNIQYGQSVFYEHVKDFNSNMCGFEKEGYNIDLRVQVYYHNSEYVSTFNIYSWSSMILEIDTPLLVQKYDDFVLLTILELSDFHCVWCTAINDFLL
ncbi:MAG: hypothetical protein WC366_02945 [Bacilli bacterium]|jgi:hypothetical protein